MIERFRIVRCLREPDDVRDVADVDADFALEADGRGDASALLARPGASLYALDHARGGVAFVETPAEADLLSAPFLHQAQRNHATHVLRVSYADFHAFAETIAAPGVPPIFVHSVGRCGSTLISDMLREVPGVASLSEPDVFTGIELAVADGALGDDDAVRVLRSAVRLASYGLAPASERPAIKFRSEVAWIAGQLDEAVPEADTLFMYRDARRVIESYLRVLGRRRGWSARLAHVPGLDRIVALRHRRHVARRGPRLQRFAYVLATCEPIDIEMRGRWGKLLIQWLAKVHAYLELRTRRDDVAALRYEDLIASPESTLRAVFEHCHLPQGDLPAAIDAMSRDSQRGTAFHRDAREAWHLSARDEREMLSTFRECTSLPGPDAVLPGTLTQS